MPYAILRHLPWNHFGRKNIGLLFALHHGAKVIYDTDDDNEIQPSTSWTEWLNQTEPVVSRFFDAPTGPAGSSNGVTTSINPYPYFGAPDTWPRGIPLDDIRPLASEILTVTAGPPKSLGVVQSLANHDPDVDAIYRLGPLPLPFHFAASPDVVVGLPPKSSSGMAPYNAQATLHFHKAFWGMLLPVTVHGRVSDIWRSYFAQALFAEVELAVAFASPWVNQYRNAHNYLADFNAEQHLYERSSALVAYLSHEWQCSQEPFELSQCYHQLYVDMYEHGIIELAEVELADAWLQDLRAIGYQLPSRHVTNEKVSAGPIPEPEAPKAPLSVLQVKEFDAISAGGRLRLAIPEKDSGASTSSCQKAAWGELHREEDRSDSPIRLSSQAEATIGATVFDLDLSGVNLGDAYWVTLHCEAPNGLRTELVLEQSVRPLAIFEDILLIVHFNRNDYQFLPDVLEMQGGSDAFPHYIAVGSHKPPPAWAAPDGPVHSRQEFNGGWGMHRTVEYAMKTFPGFRGYLLMNNDVALKVWKLGKLDRDKIWFHTDLDYGCGPKYTDPLTEPLWERAWWWKDEKDTHFWQEHFMPMLDETKKARAFETACGPDRLYSAGSDFFYVPNKYRSEYLGLLESVNDTVLAHQMEMFIPMALRLLAPEKEWERLSILHCVGPRRQKCPTIFADNATVDVLHPWKYGAENETHPYERLIGKKVWIKP